MKPSLTRQYAVDMRSTPLFRAIFMRICETYAGFVHRNPFADDKNSRRGVILVG